MADDISRLENSMAAIERLTQRLVILFELQLEKKLNKLEKNLEAASKPLDKAEQSTSRLVTLATEASRNLTVTVENVDTTNKHAKDLGKDAKKLEGSFKRFVHDFNQAVDGANSVSASTRQMLGTISSLTSTVVSSLSKFESSSAQAAAATTGMLTASQVLSKSVSYLSNTTRNITQFGVGIGGALSVLEVIADIAATQRRKLEIRATNAQRVSDIEFTSRIDLLKVTNPGISAAEIERDELEKQLKERAQLAASIAARKNEYSQRQNATTFIGGALISAGPPVTAAQQEQLTLDEITSNGHLVELESKKARSLTLKKQIENEKAAVAMLAPIQRINDALTKKLLDLKLGAAKRDYDVELQAIADAQEKIRLSPVGNSEAAIASRIELTKQTQEVAIAREQQVYDDAITTLSKNKLADREGNVLEDAILKRQKELLADFTKRLELLTTSYVVDPSISLTDAQRMKLNTSASNVNSSLNNQLAKNQASTATLNQSTGSTEAQALEFSKQTRDNQAATTNAAALARPGLYFDTVNPLAIVEIKLAKLKQDMIDYEAQRKIAVGSNVAIVDANITATRLAMEALESTDVILAARANRATDLRIYVEKLQRGILQVNANSALAGAKRNELLERRKRQLAASGTAPGAGGLIDVKMQDEDMARQRIAAKLQVDMLRKKYEQAKKNNESETVVLDLKKQLENATATQVKLLNDQLLTAAKQNSMLEYQLTGDKSVFGRFGKRKVLGRASPTWVQQLSKPADMGAGLGSESARLTKDFNESWRLRRGKLTPEEQDAAKEERKMNFQLERARRAISIGSGTKKQIDLVRMYNEQQPKEDKAAKIVELLSSVKTAVSVMAFGVATP